MPTPTAEDLNRRFEAPHLREEPPDTAQLKEEVDQATSGSKSPEKRADDPRAQPTFTFDFEYKDAAGKAWTGKFTNHILSVGERQAVGVLRSRLSGGVPISSLDALTVELNLMVAHLEYSLDDRPEWAKDLRSLRDFQLIQEVYEEVASHERFFLGLGAFEGGGS